MDRKTRDGHREAVPLPLPRLLVSVVIPAYNEEQYLPACLRALAEQKDAPPYEVIVVDNASTDSTADIARQYGARVISEARKGVSFARQAGFEAARGEIIASTDADTRVTPYWLAHMAAHFHGTSLGGVYGPVRWYDGRQIERWAVRYPFLWAQWLGHRTQRYLWWGSNFAVRSDVFCESGGFPVDWPSWEDVELSTRVRRVAPVRYDPRLVVYASSRRAREGWLKMARVALTNAVECFVLRRRPSLPMVDVR